MADVILDRGWSSIGGHVVWAAISGAALVYARSDKPLKFRLLLSGRFLKFFVVPIILHALWDSPLLSNNQLGSTIKTVVLIAIAWTFVFVLLGAGLKQTSRISAQAADTAQIPPATDERAG